MGFNSGDQIGLFAGVDLARPAFVGFVFGPLIVVPGPVHHARGHVNALATSKAACTADLAGNVAGLRVWLLCLADGALGHLPCIHISRAATLALTS